MLEAITPLILTYNEDRNIGRALANLTWAREVVVLDSGSTDHTKDLATRHENVRFVEHPFRTHAEQWNAGLDLIRTEWVLTLDADYMVGHDIAEELAGLKPGNTWGYRAKISYAINGTILRNSLYPPRTILFRASGSRYFQDGHTQRIEEHGVVQELRSRIIHDDRKPLDRWLANQACYAGLEAERILSGGTQALRSILRRGLVVTPIAVPVYLLLLRGLALDGRAGLRYALERAIAECLISIALIEHRRRNQSKVDGAGDGRFD